MEFLRTDASTLKPTFKNFYQQVTPANSEDIDAFVYDNPQQQYVVATDDAVTQAGFLETYDMNTSLVLIQLANLALR